MLATAVKTVIVDLSQGLAMAAGDEILLENAADYAQEMAEPRQARIVVVQAVVRLSTTLPATSCGSRSWEPSPPHILD